MQMSQLRTPTVTKTKPFYEWPRPEQFRKLKQLGCAALAKYDLGPADIAPLNYGENATYRVTRHRDGTRFVLRVHTPRRLQAEIRSELGWLEALYAGGFVVPRAVTTRGGEPLVTMTALPLPEARHCTLLTWVEGRHAAKCTPELLRRIGTQIARLHHHSSRFQPPRGFTRPRWDSHSLIHDPSWSIGWTRLPPSEREPFREVAEQFKRLAAKLVVGPQVFGLIHGDFTFDNVLLYRRDLRIIDFDDCGFGYFLYDIATLLDRIEWREDYPSLRAALIEGYRKECSFSSGHERLLDLFLLVRWTFLGLAFLSAPEYAPGRAYAPRFLKIVVPKMRKYLQNL